MLMAAITAIVARAKLSATITSNGGRFHTSSIREEETLCLLERLQ